LLLDRVGLTGRAHLVLNTPDGEAALLVEIANDEMLQRWKNARAAVADTRRWPIVCCSWSPGGFGSWSDQFREADLFSRWSFQQANADLDPSPTALIARANDLDLDSRLDAQAAKDGEYWSARVDEWIAYDLPISEKRGAFSPDQAALRAAATQAPNDARRAVERLLYGWERQHGYDAGPPLDYQDWFVPDDSIALVLLPTSVPWEVHAYVSSLFDIGVYGGEIVIAAARRWHERWGAEPVALWGTMMQFTVSHRPATPDDAWMLAREHDILAANTLSNPGIPLRDHARALTVLDRWFLHSRP
jgi:hypothetical protein